MDGTYQKLWRKVPYEVEKDGKKVLLYGGDFMDRPTDYNFCGNGIVFADRTITPKALEVKYLYQNVKISPNETGCLIKNRNLFENLSNYEFIYTIEKEEKVLQLKSLGLKILLEYTVKI